MPSQNHNIDVLKYLMSVMIIMIHVGYSIELPILRAAVPVFFIISSYFFFKKISTLSSEEQNKVWINFIKRALKLYLFWFIVLLPVTIVALRWFQDDIFTITWNLVRGLTIGSTFLASWYISAYIIGISLIYKFRRYKYLVGFISLGCYILCTISSNYCNLLDIQCIKWDGVSIYNSFPVGLIFIFIGKNLADKKKLPITIGIAGTIIGFALLSLENYLIVKYNLRKADDCYVSLLVLSPSIFILFNSLPNRIKTSTKYIRNMSTIYYCSHYSMIVVIGVIVGALPKFQLFTFTWLTVTFLSFLLLYLSSMRRFSFLKYSY